ncbi:hypothetical protein GCM10022277_08630 [Litoribacillus peritrichatus]|uniref:Uncharacterized protein n=2 Tax=Litoribacillus peritrichatus TaxID=718191 RepID=A0ABP7M7L4_9GAMM
MLGGGIYRIKQNKIMLWLSSEKIPYPNGLSWHDGKLYVASWGKGMNADFTTQTLGGIYHIDEENPEAGLTETVSALGNLDGIAWIDDRLYVSDWITGVLYKIDHGVREPVLTLAPGLADIGSEGRLLFTPMMHQGEVTAWRL